MKKKNLKHSQERARSSGGASMMEHDVRAQPNMSRNRSNVIENAVYGISTLHAPTKYPLYKVQERKPTESCLWRSADDKVMCKLALQR